VTTIMPAGWVCAPRATSAGSDGRAAGQGRRASVARAAGLAYAKTPSGFRASDPRNSAAFSEAASLCKNELLSAWIYGRCLR
jgi:hypothetical protein